MGMAADGRQRAPDGGGDAAGLERPEALVPHAEARRLFLLAVTPDRRERERPALHRRGGRRLRAAERQRRGRRGERRRGGARRGRARQPGSSSVQEDDLGQDGAEEPVLALLIILPTASGGCGRGGGGLVGGGLLLGGVVGRRRREGRKGSVGDGVVLGRARLRLPQEGHGPRRRHAVVHPERRRGSGALPGEELGEHLAPTLLELERRLLLLALAPAEDLCHGRGHFGSVAVESLARRGRDRSRQGEGNFEAMECASSGLFMHLQSPDSRAIL
jgi:hypothetical protein